MPDSLLFVGLFAFIVFAPCLVALVGSESSDGFFASIECADKWRRPRFRGRKPAPLRAMLPELPVSEDFEIRSFPKGLSQRRIVVRDTESGVKLTIAQVRAAAVELVKLGGMVAAYQYALVTAASAVAMASVKDAVAIAARDALEAARNAYAWFAWGDAMTRDHTETTLWDQAPPKIQPKPVRLDSGSWRQAPRAA